MKNLKASVFVLILVALTGTIGSSLFANPGNPEVEFCRAACDVLYPPGLGLQTCRYECGTVIPPPNQ